MHIYAHVISYVGSQRSQGQGAGGSEDVRSSLIANSDDVAKKQGMDKTAKNIQKQIDRRNQAVQDDKNLGTLEPVDMKAFITERQHKEDTGAYVSMCVIPINS